MFNFGEGDEVVCGDDAWYLASPALSLVASLKGLGPSSFRSKAQATICVPTLI